MRGLQTACSTPVQADMVVAHDSDAARDGHDGVLEFLLENHPLDCPVCDKGGECPLQDRTFTFGPPRLALRRDQAPLPEAARPLAAHRPRPRALHLVLPLRALQPGGRRGRRADHGGPRRRQRDRHLHRRRLRGPLHRQRHRPLPGGRAHEHPLPLRRAALGHRATPPRSAATDAAGAATWSSPAARGGSRGSPAGPDPNYAVEEGWLSRPSAASPTPGDCAPDRLHVAVDPRRGPRARRLSLDEAVEAAALVLGRGRAGSASSWARRRDGRGGLPGPGARRAGRCRGASCSGSASRATGSRALRARPSAQLGDIDARRARADRGRRPGQPAAGGGAAGAQGAPPGGARGRPSARARTPSRRWRRPARPCAPRRAGWPRR